MLLSQHGFFMLSLYLDDLNTSIMNESMFILVNLNTNECYYSKCLKPLSSIVGCSTETLRKWLKDSNLAARKGYFIGLGDRLKTNQGKGNANNYAFSS